MLTITDVVRYVAGEIAVDGDGGSTLEQVYRYVEEYTKQSDSTENIAVDDGLVNYVLKCLLSSSSNVRITALNDDGKEAATSDSIAIDWQSHGNALKDLKAKYGNRIRLVADTAAIKAATSGNIDLTPPQIRVLQNVLRNRGEGTSFPTLCKLLNTNTSNVWFQVKVLCELGLVIKARSDNGKGSQVSHAVAVKFAHLSPLLKANRLIASQGEGSIDESDRKKGKKRKSAQEDDDDEEEEGGAEEAPDLRLTNMSQRTLAALTDAQADHDRFTDGRQDDDDAVLADDDVDQQVEASDSESLLTASETTGLIKLEGLLAFPEITDKAAIRALARDKKQIRFRILKLVTESRNMTTTVRGLTIRLGVRRYSRLEGRAMQTEVRPMVDESLLEFIPALDQNERGERVLVKCLRATEKGVAYYHNLKVSPHLKELRKLGSDLKTQLGLTASTICIETPIERQILESISRSGPRGITIEEMHSNFCGSDERKRDLDRWLNAMKSANLPQYNDLKIDSTLEQAGRVRLSRFWTQFWRPQILSGSSGKKKGNESRSQAEMLDVLRSAVNMPLEIPLPPDSRQSGDLDLPSDHSSGMSSAPRATPARQDLSTGEATQSDDHSQLMPVRPKGRPRKNFSQESIEKANRARLSKGLPPLPNESMQPPQSSPLPTPAKRARKATKATRATKTPLRNTGDANVTTNEALSHSSPSKGSILAPVEKTLGHLTRQSTRRSMQSSQNHDVDGYQPVASDPQSSMVELPNRAGDKITRANMTVQLKFDKMREFFEDVKVIEATRIERDYQKFVNETVAQDSKRPPYEMDRKVRKRLLTAMEKAGVIRSRNTVGPPPRLPGGRSSMMTLYYISDLDMRQVQSYGRALVEDANNNRRLEDMSWKEQAPIGVADVDLPTSSALSGRTTAPMMASSLQELITNPSCREQMASYSSIRAYYAGRLMGVAARMQFLHQQVWNLIVEQRDDGSEGRSAYVIDRENGVVDMRWWTSEATLAQALALVIPPNEEAILEASQDELKRSLPLSQLDSAIKDHFQLSDDEPGSLLDSLRVIMQMLVALGLATPYTSSSDVNGGDDTWTTTYRFEPSKRNFVWSIEAIDEESSSKSMKLVSAWESSYFADPEQCKKFWVMFSRASKYDQQRRPLEKQARAGEEVILQEDLLTTLSSPTPWSNTYKMLRAQVFFFDRSIQLGVKPDSLNDADLLKKLSYAGLAPLNIVKRFYMRRFEMPMDPALQPRYRIKAFVAQRKSAVSRRMLMPQRIQVERQTPSQRAIYPLTKRQALRIAREARRARQKKREEFDELVDDFMETNDIESDERDILAEGLRRAREAFANGEGYMTMDHVKAMLKSVQSLHISGETDSYNTLVRQTTEPRARKVHRPQQARDDTPQDASILLPYEERVGRRRAGRKSGFEWTSEMDEMLRDCGVILRARDKHRSSNGIVRKNWAALKQVFPMNSSSALLSRFLRLQNAVGEQAYLAQLEVAWTKLWIEHRGTAQLKDDNPRDATAFDLREHVKFLRERVSKNEVMEILRRGSDDPLPLDVHRLAYDLERPAIASMVADPTSITPRYIQSDSLNEMRGDILERAALTVGMFDGIHSSTVEQKSTDEKGMDMSKNVVKMILGTEESQYEEALATQFCTDNCTENLINRACRSLLLNSMLKHRSSEGRLGPNRNLAYTDDWQSFMSDEGLETLPPWQTLSTVLRFIDKEQNHGQPITLFRSITDSDAAGFITLAEKGGAIDIHIDTKPIANFSRNRLFNAKKLTDADLELPISFGLDKHFDIGNVLHDKLKFESLLESAAILDAGSRWLERFSSDEQGAQVRQWKSYVDAVKQSNAEDSLANMLLPELQKALLEAGEEGLTRNSLQALCSASTPLRDIAALIDILRTMEPPLVFESGDDELRLVACCFARQHSVRLPHPTAVETHVQRRILPRPWLDIGGRTIARIWHDAVALILFAIYMRPGVTLAQIVAHMAAGALSRSDVVHIVLCICQTGLTELQLSEDPTITGTMALWQAGDDSRLAVCWTQPLTL